MWAALALGIGAALAASDAVSDGPIVYVNEEAVLTSRSSLLGKSPAARAREAAAILASARQGDQVAAVPPLPGDAPAIWRLQLSGRTVYSIGAQEAALSRSAPADLARLWAAKINAALAMPELQISAREVVLPPDRSVRIQVKGSEARIAKASLANPSLGRFFRKAGEIRFEPLGIGETVLNLEGPTSSAQIVFRVLPYAGRPASGLTAEVMGQGAPTAAVLEAASTAFRAASAAGPFSRFQVVSSDAAPLPMGSASVVRVRGIFSGPQAFPWEGVAEVRVRNVGPAPVDQELWYSNDPENLPGPAALYWGALRPGSPVRLLTHHKNATSRPLALLYTLSNPSSAEVRVGLMVGEGRPNENPTLAGYEAGDQYLELWQRRGAQIITIPPQSSVALQAQTLVPEATASSLGTLFLLDSPAQPVILEGRSMEAGGLPAEWAQGGRKPWIRLPELPITQVGASLTGAARAVFSPPQKQEEFRYEAGGRFIWFRIGEKPIASVGSPGALLGNFGVVYQIRSVLANPKPKAERVQVLFESSAGYNGALFLINGVMVRMGMVQAKEKKVLIDTMLQPGEERLLSIVTIPLSGASYPATILVRPWLPDDEVKDEDIPPPF